MTDATPLVFSCNVQPDGKAYGEVARVKVGSSQTHARPVVSGNRLFVKDQDAVILFDTFRQFCGQ